jgi:hypothetical protein
MLPLRCISWWIAKEDRRKVVISLTKGEDNEESTYIYINVSLGHELITRGLWW